MGRVTEFLKATLVVLAIALVLVGPAGCRSSVETKVDFLRDWEAAKDQAASEGKPIMINFYTDTCPYCNRLDAETFSDDNVSAFINGKLVPVKSNAGRSRLFASYLEGSQFPVPQTVFTDASGAEIDRIIGYVGPVQFLERMQSILTGYVS